MKDKTGPVTRQHGDTSLPPKRLGSGIHVNVSVRRHHIGLTAESRGSNVRRFRDGALGPPSEEDCQPEKIVLNSVAVNFGRHVNNCPTRCDYIQFIIFL